MAGYGYNPAQYINDFSWIGDIGRSLAGTVTKLPELIEYNKMLHTNNQFKQMNYEAMHRMVDNVDENTLSKLAHAFGITVPDAPITEGIPDDVVRIGGQPNDMQRGPRQPEFGLPETPEQPQPEVKQDSGRLNQLRDLIKQKIPTFHDTMDNGEYAKKLAHSFAAPIANLLFDNSASPSDFFAFTSTLPSDIQSGLSETDLGQTMGRARGREEDMTHQQSVFEQGMGQEGVQHERDQDRSREVSGNVNEGFRLITDDITTKLGDKQNLSEFDIVRMAQKEAADHAKRNNFTEIEAKQLDDNLKRWAQTYVEERQTDEQTAVRRHTVGRGSVARPQTLSPNDLQRATDNNFYARELSNTARKLRDLQDRQHRADSGERKRYQEQIEQERNKENYLRNRNEELRSRLINAVGTGEDVLRGEFFKSLRDIENQMRSEEREEQQNIVDSYNAGDFNVLRGFLGRLWHGTNLNDKKTHEAFKEEWERKFPFTPAPELKDGKLELKDGGPELQPGGTPFTWQGGGVDMRGWDFSSGETGEDVAPQSIGQRNDLDEFWNQ